MRHLCAAFVLGAIFVAAAGPNKDASLALDYNGATEALDNQLEIPRAGETFWIAVVIQDARDLDSYSLRLSYNAEAMQFVSAYPAYPLGEGRSFLESAGGSCAGQIVKSGQGVVEIASSIKGDLRKHAPDGDGVLACLRFKALSGAPPSIVLKNARLIDPSMAIDEISAE